jgi:2-keto-4-pentenoate hydratase
MPTPAPTADFLAALRFEHRTADTLPAELRPHDTTTAYVAQDALVERIVARYGGHPMGYKIACTNPIAQQLMGVNAPVYGRLLSSCVYPSPAQCSAKEFTIRGIEPEFAFELGRDVPPAEQPYTAETIAPYVAHALPSIEIVDHRFAGWDAFDAYTLIADNAIHGAWIPGAPCPTWQDLELQTQPLRLLVHEKEVASGSGAAVLGHPLNALAWLANELPQQGRALRQGERVTTGLATDLYVAQPGDRVRADFGVFGSVEVTFA